MRWRTSTTRRFPGTSSLNPTALGAFAMSAPAWDAARRAVWYTDANKGFFVVALTNDVGRLLLKKKPK